MVNDMKRKVNKLTKRRLSVFGTLSLIAIIYFSVIFIFHMYTIIDLKKQKQELDIKYESLQNETDELQLMINKLNNRDYLARYAREKYSYSKDGEYIIKLSDTKKESEKIDDELNLNYIIICLSSVIFIIFIYIIVKSRKSK